MKTEASATIPVSPNSRLLMWLAVATYPFFYIWQGLNFSDEGNALTLYQRALRNPEAIADAFGTWGTSVLGALWNEWFGQYGVLGFRVAGALVSLATFVLAYQLVQRYLDRRLALLGLLLGVLFSYHFFSPVLFGYNNLSALMYVAVTLLLARGLMASNHALIAAAGVVLGAAVFVRLPNVTGVLMGVAIPFYGFVQRTQFHVQTVQSLLFLGGVLAGVAIVWSALVALGHEEYFRQSLDYLFAAATPGGDGAYGNLVAPLLMGYLRLFRDGILMGLLFMIAVRASLLFTSHFNRWFWTAVLVGGSALFLYVYPVVGVPISGRVASFIVCACIVVLFANIMSRSEITPEIKLVSCLVLIQFLIWPMGSGAGFVNQLYVLPLGCMLLVHQLGGKGTSVVQRWMGVDLSRIFQFIVGKAGSPVFMRRAFLLLLVFSSVNGFAFTYDDSYNRFSLRRQIENEYLAGVFTTQAKAESLSDALAVLKKHVAKDDTLFVAWTAPILNYATETKPYFPHPWSEIYTEPQIRKFFSEREKSQPLPVTVRYRTTKYDALLKEFLQRHRYQEIWHNNEFSVYIPGVT